MAHDVLIALHAAAGVICFVAGALSLTVSTSGSWRFRSYLLCLIAMVVFLGAALVDEWTELTAGTRWMFFALFLLALFMLARAFRATILLRRHGSRWRERYLDDIGFTLISLFEGFVIIAAIDLGMPGWLVVAVAIAGLVAGILTMNRVKSRVITQPAVNSP